jgi:hypothetical protein
MTKQTATSEAQQYVARLMKSQGDLGYKSPAAHVVQSAVGEAAEAVKALAALAAPKSG